MVTDMHDAREVANFLLDRADERRILLTNMEIIKHIYFAHGWHLVAKETPLIKNRIEAWQYGPVIRSIYDCFKEFGSQPITSRATVTDWSTGEIFTAAGNFSEETSNFLESSLLYYSGHQAFALSEMTHAQGGPWDRVWNARDGRVRMNMEISNHMIREHFAHGAKIASRQ
jgi:uncharacterized phage-associated protein